MLLCRSVMLLPIVNSVGRAVRPFARVTPAFSAPVYALYESFRSAPSQHSLYPERRSLPNATPAVYGGNKAFMSTLGSAAVRAGSLPPPLLTVPSHPFSSSTTTAAGALVKVGVDGRYLPFSAPALVDMNVSDLLKALKADDMFSSDLKDVNLGACRVFVFKGQLPSGRRLPTAADEAATKKFVELKAADTIGGDRAGSTADGYQFCIRVRLPTTGPADPAKIPTVVAKSTAAVNKQIDKLGCMVVADIALSSNLEDQRAMTGLGDLLLAPLPLTRLDAQSGRKPGLAAEFLPYVGSFKQYAAALQTTSAVGDLQKAHVVAVVQASGSGKTRLAYADGQNERLVVLARVFKEKAFTPVWDVFMKLSNHWKMVLPRLDASNRRLVSLSALAAMRLLAACHVMHVARVLRCLSHPTPAMQRAAALRCLRNGRGEEAVQALYQAQLARRVSPTKLPVRTHSADASASVGTKDSVEVAMLDPAAVDAYCTQANKALRDQLWPGAEVVLWWDEAHALLTDTPKLFSPAKLFAAGGSAEVAEMQDCFYGLTVVCSDLCDSKQLVWLQVLCGTYLELSTRVRLPDISPLRGRVSTVFHASRITTNDMLSTLTHYLHLDEATVYALRPYLEAMQGRPIFFHTHFLQAFWQRLLNASSSAHAASGSTVAALGGCSSTACAVDASALRNLLVEAALSSVDTSRQYMSAILTEMSTLPSQCLGRTYQTLIVELYAALRMNRGVATLSHDAGSKVLERGLLALPLAGTPQASNLRFDEATCRLDEEPISADAIRFRVEGTVKDAVKADGDPIFQLLSDSLASGGSAGFKLARSAKGPLLELAFAWHVLRSVLLHPDGRPTLHDVLQPLAAPGFKVPDTAKRLVVARTVRGASCDDTLRGDHPTDLHLWSSRSGQELVLTNIDPDAGVDVLFTVFQKEAVPAGVPVFVQARAQKQASLRDCLRAASPAWQYTDEPERALALQGRTFKPSAARAAYQKLATEDPASSMLAAAFRVALSVTGYRKDTVALVNALNDLPHGCQRSPIILCQPTEAAFGAVFSKQLIAECCKEGLTEPTTGTTELAFLLPQSVVQVAHGKVTRIAPAAAASKTEANAGGASGQADSAENSCLIAPDDSVIKAVSASRTREL